MCTHIIGRAGRLLYKVGCHASRVATAVLVARAMTVSAAIGGDIILHAYHSVGMMMVGNDGYHQHYQADEKKEYRLCTVSFSFLYLWTDAKIEVKDLITK